MSKRFKQQVDRAIRLTKKYNRLEVQHWRQLFHNCAQVARNSHKRRVAKKWRNKASRAFLAARYLEGSVDRQGFTYGRT